MTDEDLDRLIRSADPYRARDLDGAESDLLGEIMSIPTLEPLAEPPTKRRRFLGTGARAGLAAAACAAALAGALALTHSEPPTAPHRQQERQGAPVTYSALALKAAEGNPRLLIDEPGWKATYVTGFAEQDGSIRWTQGNRDLEMNWRPAQYYGSFRQDRLGVSKPEPVTVDGQQGELFRYDDHDFEVLLAPRGDTFVSMRTGGSWTRSSFGTVLAEIERVDVRTWLAALPPEVVTPDRAGDRAAEIIKDIPLPPGFDKSTLDVLGTNDPYQFGAAVTGKIGCAWIDESIRAKKAGDTDAEQRALDALKGSHHWKVLLDLQSQGDWPRVFWGVADKTVAGQDPTRFAGSIGCGS
ncbi:hypothetical protein [Cryptosporangium phraense]|uniref:Uncharacterized protein n=1 Tax=Cryptosporangium phraense TaxID=2593070 RepID=A0A545AFB2_9ACTN|nr:hypothetical protein [Cryptosporangium phraense]TQS40014.1 hypothetical protein FL583_36880 [Cryptosporangium phraense]